MYNEAYCALYIGSKLVSRHNTGMLKGYKISENMSILIMSKTKVIMKDAFFPEAPLNSFTVLFI